jgi:hypothetical protein
LYVNFKQALYVVESVLVVFGGVCVYFADGGRDSCKAGENDLMKEFRTSFLPTYNILLLCEINIAGGGMPDKNLISMGSKSFEDPKKINEYGAEY